MAKENNGRNPFGRYVKIKIKSTLVLTFIVVAGFLSFRIIIMSSNFFKNVMRNSLIESANNNLKKSIEMLDIKLQSIYRISCGVVNDQKLKEIVTERDDFTAMAIEEQNKAREILLNYCSPADYIYSVNVFKNNYNKARNRFTFHRLEDTIGFGVSDYKILDGYMSNKDNKFYSYKQEMYFSKFYNSYLEIPTICAIQTIYDRNDKEPVGTLNINIRSDYLFRHMINENGKYISKVYIMDKKGNEIYYGGREQSGEKIGTHRFLKDILRRKSGWITKDFFGREYIVVFNTIGTINWIVAELIPHEEIMRDFEVVRSKIILLSVLVSVLVAVLYILIASNIVKPLQMMVASFKMMQKGDLNVRVERSVLFEVDELSENFNKMVKTINTLLKEIEIANKKERDAELKALQSQINPHFLYNTLDTIYWMSDNPQVSSIIYNLGRFFRLSLSKGKNIITVQEELEQVRVYINIQLIRFNNKFIYIDEVDKEVYNCCILKLILQPLVENSLLHGFKYLKEGGVIKVYNRIANGNLELFVEDNGTGIDIERINHILNGNENTEGYGIRNVNERIKVKYGDNYGLSYSNIKGGGTLAKVVIPINYAAE